MKVFLTGGHVATPLETISVYLCGTETVKLETAGALTFEKVEEKEAIIPKIDLDALFVVEYLKSYKACSLDLKYELYSDSGLTTVWNDAKVVFDKTATTITVDSSVPFAKKTAYYAVTTKGSVKFAK